MTQTFTKARAQGIEKQINFHITRDRRFRKNGVSYSRHGVNEVVVHAAGRSQLQHGVHWFAVHRARQVGIRRGIRSALWRRYPNAGPYVGQQQRLL
ncbi:MAG: hypothetical protein P8M78_08690 [Myxococcota bacterium]|nr:hypothetical protein [Myxococcota bacterium]